MSVGEWLNTVIQPAEENDEDAWWSGETESAPNDQPKPPSEYGYPEREPYGRSASSWRGRQRRSDQPRRPAPPYDEARDPDRNGSSRRREREADEFRRSRQRHDGDRGYRDREPPRRARDHGPEDQQRRERWRRDQSPQEQSRQEQSRDAQRRQRQWHEDQWHQAFGDDDRRRHRERGVPRHDREPDEQLRLNFQRDDRGRQPPDADWRRQEHDTRDRHGDPRPIAHEGGAYRDRRGQGSPNRDQEARADHQRLERQRFAQAAASAAAKQSRDNSIDQAVAEITARQQALDGDVAAEITARPHGRAREAAAPSFRDLPPGPPPHAPEPEPERVFAAWPGGWRSQVAAEAPVNISGLEEQLRQMTARIEALRPSSELEKAIAGLRTDLADIARSLTEALPRRALESLETEVRALGQRIDVSRQAGVDAAALAGIERGLAEVHQALNALTPAEGLIGFDETVKALGSKIDAVVGKDDPGALPQLEAAISSLRGIVSHVASNDTLNKVAEDVRALSAKVDSLASSGPSTPTLAALENRIDILASALNASTEAGHAVPRELEQLLSSLIGKLERVQLSPTDHAALSHLEDRIAALVNRLDASDARLGTLEGVERGLADLLAYIDQLRDEATLGAKPAPVAASAAERGLGDVKQSPRQVQETLDAAGGTTAAAAERRSMMAGSAALEQPKAAAQPMAPSMPAASPPPLQVDETDQTNAAATAAIVSEPFAHSAVPEPAPQRPAATRTPIDPSLPPDHPLEPGSATRPRGMPSAADRIATSEAAAGAKPPVIPDPGGKPDYIAAARRAAQAAAAASPEGRRLSRSATAGTTQPKKLTERLRMIAVAAAVVVIVVGGFHIISRLFEDSGSNAPAPAQTEPPRGQSTPQLRTEPQPQMAPQVRPEPPAQKGPPHVEAEPPPPANSATLPTPATEPAPNSGNGPDTTPGATPGQQSQLNSVVAPVATGSRAEDRKAGGRAPASNNAVGAPLDISGTGSLPNPSPSASPPRASPPRSAPSANERLPSAIGGPTLRIAALAGDPLAAYEVGVRFAEGRAVPANNEEAARWFDVAAKKGVVPAQFRLATLYEKGLGVKKDLAVARDLYRAAADGGHGKAMHNLAVLYAEGADGKPDYNTAAVWFRKAADHGITDSQYNLAILYARGVGVEQNLAEAYKWFFLAAKEGDRDAAQKRDQIAPRLDPQALAAARAAVESWTALPQPADAVTVKGNWDAPPAAAPAAPKPKPRSAKAAASDAAKVN
jgi:localization factor PodJL